MNHDFNIKRISLIIYGQDGYIAVFRQPRIQTRQYVDQ